jgi:hypothetical protein
MAINLASKFETKTSELMTARAKTSMIVNKDWSWDGVNSINIYTLTDPTMGNYDAAAASARYGTASEVQDTIQTFTLSRDRSWTKTIDKSNYQDTQMVRKPGKYLAQATKNVLVPEIDTYRLSALDTAAIAGSRVAIVAAGATTASNAWENFLTLNADISDNEAPEEGRVAVMTAAYYNFLKQGGFVLDSDSAYRDRKSGNLGTVDNVKVIVCPSSRMASNVDLVITHPSVMVAPEKLVDYTLHKNAPGYSGDLLEYRHRYDAFVDVNKINSVAEHKTA